MPSAQPTSRLPVRESPALRPDGGLSAPLSRRLMTALERGDLSLRGVDRVLRLAWTLADLEGLDTLSLAHIGTALALRTSGVRP